MEYVDFIEQLKTHVAQEDLLAISNDVNELRTKFNDYVLEEERKQQVAQLKEDASKEADESLDQSSEEVLSNDALLELKESFYEIYNDYKKKKKEIIDARNETESKNLTAKRALIAQLQKVVTTEENIGTAFASFKEIQENWKVIGDIPRAKRNEIQAEYSKLLEDFFYNIKIYKELKDHDFHRNYQLKTEVIERLKALIEIKSIKEVESQLKSIQNDWEDIGPVPNEKWEAVKDAYWTEVRSSYERINRFYDDRRSKQQENLKKKQALLETIDAISNSIETLSSVKEWDAKTSEILAIQKEWKTIGFGPKKENDEIWKAFRASCDVFFDAKKVFFGKVNEAFDGIAKKKQVLIEKAVELSSSTEWKETANKLIQLQKQWKTIGHSGRKNEQKLWKAFREACDNFFNARKAYFDDQDKAFENNLADKEALLTEIQAYKLPADKKEALTALKAYSDKFNAIGKVPMRQKDGVFKRFKGAMDTHYGALKVEGSEKNAIMFKAKIDTIQSSPDAARMFRNMKNDLRKDIEKHQKEITLLGNNLGFFANSKGADALKKDVEKKINRAQKTIDDIKQKLKLIPNE